jgi:5-methylcytosine-specific restriction endonuclease McrA
MEFWRIFDFTTREGRQRFYHHKYWYALRDRKRILNPLCETCLNEGLIVPMEDVDHILDIESHPYLSLEISNLQSLCKKHHSQKTFQTRTKESIGRKKENPGGVQSAFPQEINPI